MSDSNRIKEKRNRLLHDCDWMFSLYDRPIENKESWITYRQELRDITKQAGFPDEVIWPTRPDFIPPSLN